MSVAGSVIQTTETVEFEDSMRMGVLPALEATGTLMARGGRGGGEGGGYY